MDDSQIDSADEGLELLLGGLSVTALSPAAWDSEEQCGDDATRPRATAAGTVQPRNVTIPGTQEKPPRSVRIVDIETVAEEETYGCYDRAFHSCPSGELSSPPVRIVDMSSVNNRGNGLIATRRILEGEVIFTERALAATQLPTECNICHEDPKEPWQTLFSVRACQNCFRSLEPISGVSSELPMRELWPVPEYQGSEDNGRYRTDTNGRIQCTSCSAIFCSPTCKDTHSNKMGNCCDCAVSVHATVHALHQKHELSNGNLNDESLEVQPSTILATRMFVLLLNQYRTRSSDILSLRSFGGLCGSAEDVSALQIGLEQGFEGGTRRYTLSSVYEAICDTLSMTDNEKQSLSLELFERLAATAARNGFAVKTQSPFRTYHATLLRAAGGRGTDRHVEMTKQIAIALGSEDGTLQRDMDRRVEELCAVEVAALFSLTARINHSCDPCAEVVNQEFVDCHIDMVAKRDILAGEEITISYINVGRMAGRAARERTRRIHELRAKYLFECDCSRCTSSNNTVALDSLSLPR